MIYPTKVEYEDVIYPIDTDFKTAIKCMQINEDESISDYERAIAIIVLLFGDEIPINDDTLNLAIKYLQCGKKAEEHNSKKDMDFVQDEFYIQASFMSDYHIDLSETKMHWWKFYALICGLTENSILSKVRDIRNFDINELSNVKDKEKMLLAKRSVELEVKRTEEEEKMLEEFESLLK